MKKGILFVFVSCLSILLVGCINITVSSDGEKKDKQIMIKKDDAEALEVEIDIKVGELTLNQGTDHWLEGNVSYNVERPVPESNYKKQGEIGVIELSEPAGDKGINLGNNIENNWDLRLTNDVPIDLKVDTGASESTLNLQDIELSSLDIHSGVGELTVDLTGNRSNSFTGKIDTGIGETTVLLPKDIGVRLKVDNGIGSISTNGLIRESSGVYVNEAFEKSDIIIDLDVDMGIGEVNLKMQ
ncbi:toast rack family protein [Bacillus spongiae]|uniref:Toast rack family protein n=1 Tax=Bacillus spongiae TaxID=2683610 RepID=A0ABU8HBT6_9BACI